MWDRDLYKRVHRLRGLIHSRACQKPWSATTAGYGFEHAGRRRHRCSCFLLTAFMINDVGQVAGFGVFAPKANLKRERVCLRDSPESIVTSAAQNSREDLIVNLLIHKFLFDGTQLA